MTNIRTRLDKLENREAPGCIIVWRRPGEPAEQAKHRWRSAHPGRVGELDGAAIIYIVGWDNEQELQP